MQPSPEDVVLDGSALLALVSAEPGAEAIQPLLPHAIISTVGYCEAVARLRRNGMPLAAITAALTRLLITPPVPFDVEMAYVAAEIHERHRGLSFGDVACLALAITRNAPAVTTGDWEEIDPGVKIIRIGKPPAAEHPNEAKPVDEALPVAKGEEV